MVNTEVKTEGGVRLICSVVCGLGGSVGWGGGQPVGVSQQDGVGLGGLTD